jgi:SIR2-like domain
VKTSLDQISFLLGSGVSIPADFPRVGELTGLILSGNGIRRHTNEIYSFGKPLYEGFSDEYVPRITGFLNRLKTEIDSYYLYQNSRLTDYEDLYYVAAQVRDSELHEYDNPAVQPFVDKILPEIKPLLGGKVSEIRKKWELYELANEATNYIRDVVWHSLTKKEPSRLDHLRCIRDACLDDAVSRVYIHTLNHDTILEQYLSQSNINQVIDGFGVPQNGMRYWNPDVFGNDVFKVRLIKLHGSLNWFRFRPHEGGDWSDEKIAIPLDWDFWHSKDLKGKLQWPVDGRPMFLAGTFNKMLDYNSGVYADLHYQFHRSLKETPVLIVSGYGFCDKGINRKINEWFYSSNKHRIIIIHPNESALLMSAREAISNKWDGWLKTRRVHIITKPIEETSWQELFTYLK